MGGVHPKFRVNFDPRTSHRVQTHSNSYTQLQKDSNSTDMMAEAKNHSFERTKEELKEFKANFKVPNFLYK